MLAPDISIQSDTVVKAIRLLLLDGFSALTPGKVVLIHSLASDLTESSRAQHMRELQFRPRELTDAEFNTYWELRNRRQCLAVADGILSRDAVDGPNCNSAEAAQVAMIVNKQFWSLQEYEKFLSEEQTEELARVRKLWYVIRPFKKQLTDCRHVAAVFTGEVRPSAKQMRALRELLIEAARLERRWIGDQDRLEARVRRLYEQRSHTLSQNPKELIELDKYIRGIEKGIVKTLGDLNRS